MEDKSNLYEYLAQSLRNNWEQLSLTDFHGVSFQYRDVARKIAKLHILFEQSGIKRDDKIAICGRNSSHWAVAFFAIIGYGAVAVPILNEFKPDNIHHIVTHSDSKLLFIDEAIWENLDPNLMPKIEAAVQIKDFSLLMSRSEQITNARAHLNEMFGHKYPERFTPDDVVIYPSQPDDVALINYTSGSTGFSKGVILTHKNLWSNLQYCLDNIDFLFPGDPMVSMLPMAHMYGLAIEIIFPFVRGCHINFLTKVPSPKVIMEAFGAIKPKLIISVPLILEKIIKTKVFPLLDKPLMKILMHVPFVDDHLMAKIKTQLTNTFGGQLREFIIGGAGLSKDVETFLRKIGFPFTVGYGMTECAPLITYAPWHKMRPGSCGRSVDRMELRVASDDPANVPGIIWVRGDNVMKGYFKNPEATESTFDKDGWMSTGDIGNLDADGYLYIRGRDKNMILGPSGQNIYPEEIEQKLNNMPYVCESIVIDEDGKLVALIYPDFDNFKSESLATDEISKVMDDNIVALNKELPTYSQIRKVKLMSEEFEKTPKRSIKRYLYQHS